MYQYWNPYAVPYTGYGTSTSLTNGQQNLSYQNNTPSAPQIQPQSDPNQVVFYYVQNRAAADNWLLGKNERVYLMDSSEPIMYLKATDQDGRYLPMRTFDLVERVEQVQGPNEAPNIDTSSFVTRDEIDGLVAKAVLNYLNAPAKKGE